jgi:hypothetical protein
MSLEPRSAGLSSIEPDLALLPAFGGDLATGLRGLLAPIVPPAFGFDLLMRLFLFR